MNSAGDDPGKAESLSNRWLRRVDQALACIWPRDCFVCGENSGADAVCAACNAALPRLPRGLCPICALPSADGLACGRCQRRRPYFDASYAVFAYDHPVREMVLALKHGQGPGLASWLAVQLAGLARASGVDCIVPMPLHRERLRHRGFNQAVELGRRLARLAGVPLWTQAVVRDTATPLLAGLRRKARRSALRGAFRAERSFAGLHVLVLDDVMTSGATLDEMARTLKQRGAVHVSNLVVARTLRLPRR